MNYIYRIEVFPAGHRVPDENLTKIKSPDLKLASELAAAACDHTACKHSSNVCVHFSTKHGDFTIAGMWKFKGYEDGLAVRIRKAIRQAIADSPWSPEAKARSKARVEERKRRGY